MFGHEGGYVNAKTDRGGPTKYGITHKTLAVHRGVKSVTADQVKAMTLAEAEAIYRKSYWVQSGGDLLPAGLDYAAFDFGVNSGPPRAVKTLQKVLGVTQDGWIGLATLAAVEAYQGGIANLIRDYCDGRMAYLESLTSKKTGFPVNGRGWTIRVTGKDPKGEWADQPGVVGHALELATKAGAPTAPEPAPNPLIELQTVLKRLGLYTGRVDGIDGRLTQAALTAFNAISADVSAWQQQLEN
ncbi:glycosyl hydrolase 108 family protein [Paracoccus aerius]